MRSTHQVIYIAGPMTGIENDNAEAFNEIESMLRAGYPMAVIINPINNPKAPVTATKEEAWIHYMRLSIAQISQSDAVWWLPGWENSRGARLERVNADALNLLYLNEHFDE